MRQREFWSRLKRNRMAMTGLALVLGLFVVSVGAPWLAPYDPLSINLKEVLMRLVDLMLCFPAFFLILAVIAVLEPSIWNIMAVIGLTSWMGVARLVRAEFLSLREREFVTAARALGAGDTPPI